MGFILWQNENPKSPRTQTLPFGHRVVLRSLMWSATRTSSHCGHHPWMDVPIAGRRSRRGSRILVMGGPSKVLTPMGGPWSQNVLKIGVLPLKLPENCMILKKGQGGPLEPPLSSVRKAENLHWLRDATTMLKSREIWTHQPRLLLLSTSFYSGFDRQQFYVFHRCDIEFSGGRRLVYTSLGYKFQCKHPSLLVACPWQWRASGCNFGTHIRRLNTQESSQYRVKWTHESVISASFVFLLTCRRKAQSACVRTGPQWYTILMENHSQTSGHHTVFTLPTKIYTAAIFLW